MPAARPARTLVTAEQLLNIIFAQADAAGLPLVALRIVFRDRPDSRGCNWWPLPEGTDEYRVSGSLAGIVSACAEIYNLAETEREWCKE